MVSVQSPSNPGAISSARAVQASVLPNVTGRDDLSATVAARSVPEATEPPVIDAPPAITLFPDGQTYRDLAGLPPVALGQYRVGTQWVHPVPDICALWTARRRGQPLGPSPARAWAGGANAVFAIDDPLPLMAELSRE